MLDSSIKPMLIEYKVKKIPRYIPIDIFISENQKVSRHAYNRYKNTDSQIKPSQSLCTELKHGET